MSQSTNKSLFWNEAATSSLFIGVVYTIMLFLEFKLPIETEELSGQVFSFIRIGIYIGMLYYAQKRYLAKRGDLGLTYTQSVAFGSTTMALSGVIYGIGYFYIFNYVAKDYFLDAFKQIADATNLNPDLLQESLALTVEMYSSPLSCVLAIAASSAMNGIFLSALVSIYTRRKPRNEA